MPNEIEALKLRLAAVEARLAALEGKQPKTYQVSAFDPVCEAIKEHFDQLHGRMTAAQVANAVCLPVTHSNLIKIGRHLSSIGVAKVRTASGALFAFTIKSPGKADTGSIDSIDPVDWLRGAVGHAKPDLRGTMATSAIMDALQLSQGSYRVETLHKALRAMRVEEVADGIFNFGSGLRF